MVQSTPKRSTRTTALLAEDDAMIRELVSMYLDRMGYEVLEAKNGREAIELLEERGINDVKLIVTDLVMPEAGGAELIKAARNTGKCENILIISGFTEDIHFLERALKEGSEFLKKPFTFHDFENKIHHLEARYA